MKNCSNSFKPVFILAFTLLASLVHAQDRTPADSLTNESDTIARVNDRPRKATIWALTLPGAGQIYNKKYWKVPILYAGFGGLAYAISFNQSEYKRFGDYYKAEVDDDPNTNSEYAGSPDQLRSKRNYYKKNRDLSIIGVFALYALQALDANVDAHLSTFDVNDNLSLQVMPPNNFAFQPQTPGVLSSRNYLSVTLKF